MSVTRSKTSDVIKKNIERPHLVPVVALIRIFGNADRNRMLDETVCIALPSDVALHLPTRGHFLITFERISHHEKNLKWLMGAKMVSGDGGGKWAEL